MTSVLLLYVNRAYIFLFLYVCTYAVFGLVVFSAREEQHCVSTGLRLKSNQSNQKSGKIEYQLLSSHSAVCRGVFDKAAQHAISSPQHIFWLAILAIGTLEMLTLCCPFLCMCLSFIFKTFLAMPVYCSFCIS